MTDSSEALDLSGNDMTDIAAIVIGRPEYYAKLAKNEAKALKIDFLNSLKYLIHNKLLAKFS